MSDKPTKQTIQYRTYFFGGILFDEESTSEVAERDVKAAQKDAPRGAFAFQFYERTKSVVDGEVLWGAEKNRSPRYYIGGDVFSLAEVKRKFPNQRILISNMEGNEYKHVIRTRVGNFQPFEKGKSQVVLSNV